MKTESNYNKEAKDLLKSMNVTFKADFIEYAQHFADDKECRDIYKCTFRRGKNSFSLRFGQSINESTGAGGNAPTEYDVISCLQKYDVGNFGNFCSEFGYNVDSSKAEKIYKAVCKEFFKVSNFFTDTELEQLQEIQ
jgi:hypothetical protein